MTLFRNVNKVTTRHSQIILLHSRKYCNASSRIQRFIEIEILNLNCANGYFLWSYLWFYVHLVAYFHLLHLVEGNIFDNFCVALYIVHKLYSHPLLRYKESKNYKIKVVSVHRLGSFLACLGIILRIIAKKPD